MSRERAWANTRIRTRVKAKRTKLVYLHAKNIIELTLLQFPLLPLLPRLCHSKSGNYGRYNI